MDKIVADDKRGLRAFSHVGEGRGKGNLTTSIVVLAAFFAVLAAFDIVTLCIVKI